MVDYTRAWKVRRTQLIIINVIMAVFGLWAGFSSGKIREGIILWILGAWIIETIVSSFSKSGDKLSSLAYNLAASLFAGTFAASSGSGLWAFTFTILMIKLIFGVMVIGLILAFEFVAFPFTTIHYYVQSNKQEV